MGWTKRQFIEQAFDEIGLSPFTFQLDDTQMASALRRLDAMLADWNGRGIRLGYPLASSPGDSSLDEQTNVPDFANEAIIVNLATRMSSSYGKQVTPQTMMTAKNAYNGLLSRVAAAPEMALPSMPAGAGNKTWRSSGDPFLPTPEEPLTTGQDGILEFE